MYIKRSKQAGSNCRWRHIMGRYLGEIPDLKIDFLNTRLFQLKLLNGTRQKPEICATGSQFCDCESKVSPSGMPSRVCCQHHHSSLSWPSRQRGFQELAFFLFRSRQCRGEANLPGKQCLSMPRYMLRVRIEPGYSVSHLFMALIAMRLRVREDIPGSECCLFVRYSCI